MTVSDCFQTLISRLEPLQSEVDIAAGHAGTIKSRLETTFRLKKFMPVGSHARDSAIRHFSDLDCFAVFARDEARWGDSYKSSTTFLNNIKDDLAERFWQTTVGYLRDVVSEMDFRDKERCNG